MSIPANLKYTAEHEWVRSDGDVAVVGITAYAADALGDVVYVELPDVGDTITEGVPCGEIESTKSVSDLLAPVNGEVVEINAHAVADPSVINSDPFGDGWLIKVRPAEEMSLMDADQYRELVGGGS